MAEESQYCNSRELYEARMKNEELRRQHKVNVVGEKDVQLVAYNGRRFDFTVLKKQSSEYAVESVMDA